MVREWATTATVLATLLFAVPAFAQAPSGSPPADPPRATAPAPAVATTAVPQADHPSAVTRRAALAALAREHHFSVTGLDLLRDTPIERVPAASAVGQQVLSLLREGADNYVIVYSPDRHDRVKGVIIADASVTPQELARLARLAREAPEPFVPPRAAPGTLNADGVIEPEPPDPNEPVNKSGPQQPVMTNPEGDPKIEEAIQWQRNIDLPVPLPRQDLGEANPPGPPPVDPNPPVFRNLGALSPNAPAPPGPEAGRATPDRGATPASPATPAPKPPQER